MGSPWKKETIRERKLFVRRVRDFCKREDITIEEFEQLAGLKRQTAQRWVDGVHLPTAPLMTACTLAMREWGAPKPPHSIPPPEPPPIQIELDTPTNGTPQQEIVQISGKLVGQTPHTLVIQTEMNLIIVNVEA